jgi:hypothetical protein
VNLFLQQRASGVWSLRIPKKFKLDRFPADCHQPHRSKSSQQTARFKAGATKAKGSPAKTGRDNNNKTAVITTAQPNNANFVHKKE